MHKFIYINVYRYINSVSTCTAHIHAYLCVDKYGSII